MWGGSKVGLVAPALVILIGIACSGGSGGGSASPSAGAGGGLVACEALDNLQRYRYTFSFMISSPQPATPLDETQVGDPLFALPPNHGNFEFAQEFESSVVAPDRYHMVVKAPGAPDSQLLYIGEQRWSYLSGQWIPTSTSVPVPFPPDIVCRSVMAAPDFGDAVPDVVELHGRSTRHYQFDGVEADTAGALFGTQSDMGRLLKEYDVDVWLSEDGYPARLETSSEGAYPSSRALFIELILEITDVNANDIVVEPPSES